MKRITLPLLLILASGCATLQTIRVRTDEMGAIIVKVPVKKTSPKIDLVTELKAGFNPNNYPFPRPDRATLLIKVKW